MKLEAITNTFAACAPSAIRVGVGFSQPFLNPVCNSPSDRQSRIGMAFVEQRCFGFMWKMYSMVDKVCLSVVGNVMHHFDDRG